MRELVLFLEGVTTMVGERLMSEFVDYDVGEMWQNSTSRISPSFRGIT